MDWTPRFDREQPLFWPLQEALAPFRGHARFPTIEEWNAVFPPLSSAGGAPIRFVQQPPRRRGRVVDVDAIYDERIYVRGEVPSRAGNWHDFFNMLVWRTLPRAKVAINARQRAALRARVEPTMRRLPSARTREQDLLAILDEGGALLRPDGSVVLIGHAIYEHLACAPKPVHAYLFPCRGATLPELDAELAAFLESGAPLDEQGPSMTITP